MTTKRKSAAVSTSRSMPLLACPFCGNKARAKEQEPYLPEQPNKWWIVDCSHGTRYHHKRGTGCPVMPMAYADTLTEAAAAWNTRHQANAEVSIER